jgi:hypothetical protein
VANGLEGVLSSFCQVMAMQVDSMRTHVKTAFDFSA